MVKFLIQTSGIYLLSVPGIGVVYASDFTAEVGDIHRFAYAKQITSLAGTAPRKHQSGEVDKNNLSTSHKGKNHLRVTVNQIALSLNSHCPEYHSYYSNKHFQYKDAPGKARTATANKFIKLAVVIDGCPGWIALFQMRLPTSQKYWPTPFGNAARSGTMNQGSNLD